MVTYPALFDPAPEGGFVITLPDFSWAISQGDTEEESLEMASDLLETVIREEISKGRELPRPKRVRGRKYRQISLSALASAKAELYTEFRRSGVTKSELARRTGISKTNVDRLFDLRHASRLDQIESAVKAIGGELIVSVALRGAA